MKRSARMWSTSTGSECRGPQPSTARRAVMMGLVTETTLLEPEMPAPEALPPRIFVRRLSHLQQPMPSLSSSVVERVEAMDLTDDEAEDAAEHVRRWMDQGFGSARPLTPSTVAEGNIPDASGNASFHSQETSIHPGSVANVSSVDVGPSRSGMAATCKRVARSKARDGSDLDSEFDDEFDVGPIKITVVEGTGREIPDDEELDEPVQNIISCVETAMDEAAERLLGVSNSFTWEESFESFRGVPEIFSGPTPGPLKDYDTPYDAFTDIWSEDIIELIAAETNRYAHQTIDQMRADGTLKPSSRLRQWTDTDAGEIMILFAIYMFMGIDQRTSQNEYWKSVGYLTLSSFKRLMTYDRYVLLSKFLHFVDNADVSQDYTRYGDVGLTPKLAKLVPVISHLNKKFSSLYNLKREISIDESLTLFKGSLSWVQAIRTKAVRIGIKSYELCESQTGYLFKFKIYTGKSSESADGDVAAPSVDLGGKSTKVVLELLQGLENLGHCVTMDNFYNCPALARYLKSLGFDCLGTLRTNRKHVPEEIAKAPKNVSKGTIIARQCGDVSVVAWKDTKLVTMISTYHNADTYVGSRAGKVLVKPVSVRDYNNTMGGVDLKDQKLSMYLLERKRCVKWYVKMFKRLLNVSIHNAFVMYVSSLKRRDKLPVTHREFRYALANSLVERHRRGPPEISECIDRDMRLRRDVMHVPKHLPGKGNNKQCLVHQRQGIRKVVHTKCVTCDVFLCFESCWEEWHSLAALKGREIRGRKRRRE